MTANGAWMAKAKAAGDERARKIELDRLLGKAAVDGDVARMAAALDAGADIECRSSEERMTPLMLAASEGSLAGALFLLARDADPGVWIEESDWLGMNGLPSGMECDALWFAVRSGCVECAEALLAASWGGEAPSSREARQLASQAAGAAMRDWVASLSDGRWERERLAEAAGPEGSARASGAPRI